LIGVNELKPMRRRSGAIAELKVKLNAMSKAKLGTTRNFKRVSVIGGDLLVNQVSTSPTSRRLITPWGKASS
jgi:hypothetical protein